MKATILKLAIAATVATGATAQPHHHGHHLLHKKRDNSEAEKRDVETTYVPATATVYVLGNDEVGAEEAKAGLDKGLYIVVGETTPTFTPPPAPVVTSTSSKEDAVFLEQISTTSTSAPPPTTTTTTSSTPEVTSTTSEAPATTSASSDSGSDSSYSGDGLDREFPDGELSCDEFPEGYGAVANSYMGLKGWIGIQMTPKFKWGDNAIDFIETAISGMSLSTGAFYSYDCPPGYLKSQWPSAQGNTGQSIGGLYCNSDNKLEKTRSEYKTLCQKGVTGITVVNKMSDRASVCRTNYPGDEKMSLPLDSIAGSTLPLANVKSSDYYTWQNKATTLQYYVNKKGVSPEHGCLWDCDEDHDGCGNWAPTILGVGKADDDNTYISLFANRPTSSASLDFSIDISGDINSDCWVHGSEYYGGGDGCTTTMPNDGQVVITLSD
ncbi:beta-glucosidase-domain-containing protein [Xylariomycetidae sp. FL2044]|nr:beta-glucosidase-domain-containing protein [Xylariomycetidae sp. FL2044]